MSTISSNLSPTLALQTWNGSGKFFTLVLTINLPFSSNLVNKETLWVVAELTAESNLSKRVRIVKHFLKIAKQCKEVGCSCCLLPGVDIPISSSKSSTFLADNTFSILYITKGYLFKIKLGFFLV